MPDTYPPLTSIDEYPLHPKDVYDSENVWACQTEEDNHIIFDWRCVDCVVRAERHVEVYGDQMVEWTQSYSAVAAPELKMLSWLIARSRTLGV